jgi:hypothetical protein
MTINKNVAQHAEKAIQKLHQQDATSYLRGMASIDPKGETSRALRTAALRIERGEDPKNVKIS